MIQFSKQFHILWKSNCLQPNVIKLGQYVPKEICTFLLNEGSFTKIIDSITGEITQMKLINNRKIGINQSYKPNSYLYNITEPRIYRQVWLEGQNDCKLVFASSWWNQEAFSEYQPKQGIALGKTLVENELNMHREIHDICYLYSKKLEQFFHSRGNIWSRSYTLSSQNKPFVLIQEFLSPVLISLIQHLDRHYLKLN